ncbi:glycosyltransferase family 2 protein [Litoribacillus peritrichatus]|uniref:Glycosyltransferase family 2 protein n=1 Tax=Litoribacillus peritrichatus TaxID=718191 RepID=A0ABP7MTD7_9GAMM
MYKQQRVCVVIPALNEELSIHQVIQGLLNLKGGSNQTIIDEVVVCDNGSTDSTARVAKHAGASVVYEPTPGYGRACLKAINALTEPDIILFIDADHAFLAHQAMPLISAIARGYDLAIGSRTLGRMEKGALTLPQRLGNQLASAFIYGLWHHEVTDLGPYRAINASSLDKLNMQDQTFGWTIEMQIKAIQHNLQITEIPVDTRRRIGVSKISGTIKGSIKAGMGILGMIAKLWWQEQKNGHSDEVRNALNLPSEGSLTKGGNV